VHPQRARCPVPNNQDVGLTTIKFQKLVESGTVPLEERLPEVRKMCGGVGRCENAGLHSQIGRRSVISVVSSIALLLAMPQNRTWIRSETNGVLLTFTRSVPVNEKPVSLVK